MKRIRLLNNAHGLEVPEQAKDTENIGGWDVGELGKPEVPEVGHIFECSNAFNHRPTRLQIQGSYAWKALRSQGHKLRAPGCVRA